MVSAVFTFRNLRCEYRHKTLLIFCQIEKETSTLLLLCVCLKMLPLFCKLLCFLPESVSRAKNNLVFTASLVHSEWSSGLLICKYMWRHHSSFIRRHSRNKGNIFSTRKSCQSRAWNSFLWRLISFSLQIIFDNISSRCFISSMALCSSKSTSSLTWLWPLKVTNIQFRLILGQPDLLSSMQWSANPILAGRVFVFLCSLWTLNWGTDANCIRVEPNVYLVERMPSHLPLWDSLAQEALSVSSELPWIRKSYENWSVQKWTETYKWCLKKSHCFITWLSAPTVKKGDVEILVGFGTLDPRSPVCSVLDGPEMSSNLCLLFSIVCAKNVSKTAFKLDRYGGKCLH